MDGVLTLILCDIGNTTFHFLIHNKNKKFFLDENLPKLQETIYFISVNENGTSKLKCTYKNCVDIAKYIYFNTPYIGLGIDRIVACIGQKNSIIIDAGSAITVDVINHSKHCGGFILPGLKQFEMLYSKISIKLNYKINLKVDLDKIPLNTQDAISYAIIKAIINPIKEIAKNRKIIFTGGDGKLLSEYFQNSQYIQHLIFNNMKEIIDAHYCITKRENSPTDIRKI